MTNLYFMKGNVVKIIIRSENSLNNIYYDSIRPVIYIMQIMIYDRSVTKGLIECSRSRLL